MIMDAETTSTRNVVDDEDDRDLDQEIVDAIATLVDVIKAYPKSLHGEMCVAAFRALQMDVRPVPEPGLWNTPARPDPRRLLPDGYISGGVEGIYLDKQLLQFVDVVASMVADYPEQHREELCLDFYEALRDRVEAI
jgi:hypothetical protein